MENLISKELLSEVLGYKIWIVLDCNMVGTLRYCIYPNKGDKPSEYMFPINIHELSHKCKEWAFEQGYPFNVLYKADYWDKCEPKYDVDLYNHRKSFCADIEYEAVIKACQWVLEHKESK